LLLSTEAFQAFIMLGKTSKQKGEEVLWFFVGGIKVVLQAEGNN
jgi:hypothetical protein